MASFNVVAQLQLAAPTNLKSIATSIQQGLKNISVDIDVKINKGGSAGINALNSQLVTLSKNLQAVVIDANNAATAVSKLASALGNARNIASNIANSVGQASNALKNTTQNSKDATNSLEEFGKQAGLATRRFTAFAATAGSLVAFVGAFKSAIAESLNFQRELVRLQQVGVESATALAGISAEVTRLSTTFGVSSKELIAVAGTLKQAGLSATDTKIALEALAKSSLAPSFDDMAKTTEGAISIFSQFKTSVQDLEGTLGSINAVSNAYAVESRDIIDAVRRSGAAFKATGGDLNEFIALFSSVRATTRESAESIATGLRTIFTRIQRSDTVEALRSLGVNLRFTAEEAKRLGDVSLTDQFVGAYDAVRRLNEGLGQLRSTDPRFSAIVEELGGYRQISKVLPLIQEFKTAQEALTVAQYGGLSVSRAAEQAQASLLNRVAKLKEEFLEFVRVLTASTSFQVFANGLLRLASGLIKVGEALVPVIPLFAALAAIKLGQGLASIPPGFLSGLTGGKPAKFARGGLVPGSGNGDTVPALLTPGEYVLSKPAVQAAGINNIRKFANGGLVSDSGVQRFQDGGLTKKPQGIDALTTEQRRDLAAKGYLKRKLYLPFANDSVGIISINTPGSGTSGGESYANANKIDDKKAGINEGVQRLLKEAGVSSITQRINTSLLNQKTADDFLVNSLDIINGAIVSAFEGRFPAADKVIALKGFKLPKGELHQIGGILLQKYISGLSNVPLTDIVNLSGGVKSPSKFDLVNGLGEAAPGFQELIKPPSLDRYVDIKFSPSREARIDTIGKYLNTIAETGQLQYFLKSSHGFAEERPDDPKILTKFAGGGYVPGQLSKKFDYSDLNVLGTYLGRFGGALNKDLRGGKPYLPDSDQNSLQTRVNKIIEKVPPLFFKGKTIYRGVKKEFGDTLKPGSIFEEKGFLSTSLDKNIAQSFAGESGTVLEIRVDGQERALPPELLTGPARKGDGPLEYELIFQRNKKLRILGERIENNTRFLNAEFIKMAKGGYSTDTVPALLTPGEFVFTKEATSSIGVNNLNEMNKAKPKKFAKGGPVGFATGGIVDSIFGSRNKASFQEFISDADIAAFRASMKATTNIRNQQVRLDIANAAATEAATAAEKRIVDVLALQIQAKNKNVSAATALAIAEAQLASQYKKVGTLTVNKSGTEILGETGGLASSRKERLASFGQNLASGISLIASQYLAQYFNENNIKDVVDSKREDSFVRAQATSGFFGSAGTGAVLGGTAGSIFGPLGSAIGGAAGGLVGGIYGLVTGFKDAKKELEQFKLDKTREELAKFTTELASGARVVSAGNLADFNTKITESLNSTFSVAAQKGSTAEEVSKIRNDEFQKTFGNALPEIARIVNTQIQNISKENPALGSRQILDVVGGQQTGPIAVLTQARGAEALDKELLKVAESAIRARQALEVQAEKNLLLFNFEAITRAAQQAADGLTDLQLRSEGLASSFSGQLRPARGRSFGVGLEPGLADKNTFTQALERISGTFGGNANFITEQARSADTLARVLPEAITQALSANQGEGSEGFRGRLGTILRGSGVNQQQTNIVLGNIPETFKQVGEEVRGGANQFAKKLGKDVIDPIIKVGQDNAKILDETFKSLSEGLLANTSQIKEIGALRDKSEQLLFNAIRTRATRLAERSGQGEAAALSSLSIEQILRPFVAQQNRLTGGQNLSPQAIGRTFANLQPQIATLRNRLNNATPAETFGIAARLQELTSQSDNLKEALKNLADGASSATQVLQEKINSINVERQEKLGVTERVIRGGVPALNDLALGGQAAAIAARQGTFDFLPTEFANRALDFLNDFKNSQIPGLGKGRTGQPFTGGELKDVLLANSRVAGLLNVDGRKPEKTELENTIDRLQTVQLEANEKLREIQTNLQGQFFQNLITQNAKFLTDLSNLLLKTQITAKETERDKLAAEKVGLTKTAGQAQSLADLGISQKSLDSLRQGENQKILQRIANINQDREALKFAKGFNLSELSISTEDKSFEAQRVRVESLKSSLPKLDTTLIEVALTDFQRKVAELKIPENETTQRRDLLASSIFTAGRVQSAQLGNTAQTLIRPATDKLGLNPEQMKVVTLDVNKFVEAANAISNIQETLTKFTKVGSDLADSQAQINALRAGVQNKAGGGSIFKPKGTDTVPAMLTPGEFVVNARSTAANMDLLRNINKSKGPVYKAEGGFFSRTFNFAKENFGKPRRFMTKAARNFYKDNKGFIDDTLSEINYIRPSNLGREFGKAFANYGLGIGDAPAPRPRDLGSKPAFNPNQFAYVASQVGFGGFQGLPTLAPNPGKAFSNTEKSNTAGDFAGLRDLVGVANANKGNISNVVNSFFKQPLSVPTTVGPIPDPFAVPSGNIEVGGKQFSNPFAKYNKTALPTTPQPSATVPTFLGDIPVSQPGGPITFDAGNVGRRRSRFAPNFTGGSRISFVGGNTDGAARATEFENKQTGSASGGFGFGGRTAEQKAALAAKLGYDKPAIDGQARADAFEAKQKGLTTGGFGFGGRTEADRQALAIKLGYEAPPLTPERSAAFPGEQAAFQTPFGIDELEKEKFKIIGRSAGGLVDNIPAYLSAGEYVLNSKAVKNIGVNRLNKFNSGGLVGSNPQYLQEGGVAANNNVTTSDATIGKLAVALGTFDLSVTKLVDAMGKIPTSINLEAKHDVNVVVNGLDVLTQLEPSIRELVLGETNKQITRLIETKFPDVGRM